MTERTLSRRPDGRIVAPDWWREFEGAATVVTSTRRIWVDVSESNADPFPLSRTYCNGRTHAPVRDESLHPNCLRIDVEDGPTYVYEVEELPATDADSATGGAGA